MWKNKVQNNIKNSFFTFLVILIFSGKEMKLFQICLPSFPSENEGSDF